MYLIQNFAILGGDRRQYHLAAQHHERCKGDRE